MAGSFDEFDANLLKSSVPWRVFRWRKGQRHYSGSYWSSTMARTSTRSSAGAISEALDERARVERVGWFFELGEKLYVDRHPSLAAQLSPIDQIDLELGESDRRMMELREILSNVDKAKLARGAAVIIAFSLVIGAFIGWLIYMLA